jgi:serine/threonine protein kinase
VCLVVPRNADPFCPIDSSCSTLKVPRFESRDERRVREDRVLASVRSPHVVALLGTPGADGASLLLEYLPGGTLADLLARREFLRVGEAVTIVVSLVRALSALHAAGYWHGSLSASKIMFAADGRPVLIGLSHAIPVVREDRVAATPAPAPDSDGFREIVELVAKAVGDPAIVPGADAMGALSCDVMPGSMDAAAWHQLETRFFGVGRAEPVLLVPLTAALVSGTGGAVARPRRQRWSGVTAARDLFDRERFERVVRLLREKRKLVIYSAGCLVVLGVAAAALAATPTTGERASSAQAATDGARANGHEPRDAPPGSPPAGTPGPTASAPTASASTASASAAAAPDQTQKDDPVDAAVQLLEARLECFSSAAADQRCLDAVIQPGSAMESSDRADLRSGAPGGSASSRDLRSYEVSLIERMGDAALLALTPRAAPAGAASGQTQDHGGTKPASLLIVRGEAGWRLRELFEN